MSLDVSSGPTRLPRPLNDSSDAGPQQDRPGLSLPDAGAMNSTQAVLPVKQVPGNTAQIMPSPSLSGVQQSELIGSMKMYNAHASLRTDELMNPNSTENRQILGTMVQKALREAIGNSARAPH